MSAVACSGDMQCAAIAVANVVVVASNSADMSSAGAIILAKPAMIASKGVSVVSSGPIVVAADRAWLTVANC
ncbi:MAG: hypothetical protein ABI442_10225 [Gemmatimonadaceae bacterium]